MAAAELDYVASPSAAGLASGQTRAVGVIVPFMTRWFYASVVQGAEELFREAGYDLLLYNLGGDKEARHRVFRTHLLRKRVDAVLVLSLTPTDEEVAALTRLDRPVAVVGATVEGWSSVRIDDGATARIAMRHLIDLGHRRIGYVGGWLEEQLDFAAPRSPAAGSPVAGTRAVRAARPTRSVAPSTPRETARWWERVAEVARDRGVPGAQVAMAWVASRPGVTAPIVGATKPGHLDDAVAGF